MFLSWPFFSTHVNVIVPKKTERRLKPRCFRGSQCHKAGNFLWWQHPLEVFRDSYVKDQFLKELYDIFRLERMTRSVAITCDNNIGWESTDFHEKYPNEALEHFNPNWRSTALRVQASRVELLAPMTNVLTIVYSFDEDKNRRGEYAAVIHSLYPGEDIGELDGDITEREGRIFFDWSHPGAPLR